MNAFFNKHKEYIETLIVPTFLFISYFLFRIFLVEKATFFALHASDAEIYFQMSHQPFQFIHAPFSYRVFIPAIVYILPLDNLNGFRLVNLTSLYLLLLSLYEFIRGFDFSHKMSVVGVSLFAPLYSTLYTIDNIVLVDFPAYLFFVLSLIAIQRKKPNLFGIALLLGVITKEIVLFSVPILIASIVIFPNDFDNEFVKKIGIYILCSIVVFFTVRYSLTGALFHQTGASVSAIIRDHLANKVTKTVRIIAQFNFMYLSIYYWRDFDSFLKILFVILLPISVLQMLLAVDASRMIAVNFVIFVPAGLYFLSNTIDRLSNRVSDRIAFLLIWSISISIILLSDLIVLIGA